MGPGARRVRRDADVRRQLPGRHTDRAARDLRALRHRLHGGARAVGRAGRGQRRAAAGREAVAGAEVRRLLSLDVACRAAATSSSTSRSTSRAAVPRARGAVGRGQDDAAARRSPGCAARAGPGRVRRRVWIDTRARRLGRARAAPLRLPLPGLRALPAHERLAERRLRAVARYRGASGGTRPSRCSSASGSPTLADSGRRPSRAGSASGSRSPGRWRARHRCCCSTSRSRRSTRARAPPPAASSAGRCGTPACRRCSSHTTSPRPPCSATRSR